MRAVIFANGVLNQPQLVRKLVREDDLLIAADGGLRHYQSLGLIPNVLIGDLDSVKPSDLDSMEKAGVQIYRHPAHKDFTDLELALRFAQEHGAEETYVFAALGDRWDQTMANLLLPVTANLANTRITLVDGPQEIRLIRSGDTLELSGKPGDLVSLIPLGGDALGVTTHNLEYPLDHETLFFGATRGISNVLLGERADVHLERGYLMCVLMHLEVS